MKTSLVVIGLAVAIVLGLGFYRGWFGLSVQSDSDSASATTTVDKDKFEADRDKAAKKLSGEN